MPNLQKFDALAAKFVSLIPVSAAPQNGFYIDTNGRLGFALLGKVLWRGGGAPVAITASGAVAPSVAENYVVTNAGVTALTLAAPVAGADDGKEILITSFSAFAHTLTTVGLLNTGTASVNVATFAARAGASLWLMAYQGKWNVIGSNNITFS